MSLSLPARRQRKEPTAFWKTAGVQAGVVSTAAKEKAGHGEGVYGTYVWDAGADGGRWWHRRIQLGSSSEVGVWNKRTILC